MKYRFTLTIALFFLAGCGESQTTTPAKVQATHYSETSPGPSSAETSEEFTGRVLKIIDGDTIEVLTNDGETIRVRLNGIDAPEIDQPFGEEAKSFLGLVADKRVRVVVVDNDGSGDIVGEVYWHMGEANSGEAHLNFMVVANGRGWYDAEAAPNRNDLASAEKGARDIKLVIWSGSHNPISPWEWRKKSRDERGE